jgi:dTMP kinase
LQRPGLLITFEGIDGTGKTTQFRLLADYLSERGYSICETREPGGTSVGEQIRDILLASSTGGLAPLAELSLIYAARAQHLDEVVRPALARGEIVLCDRFNDASLAYQGNGRKLGVKTVKALDKIICGRTQPDLTILLDMNPRRSLVRALGREAQSESHQGRFEAQGLDFHSRVRAGYLALARSRPKRIKVVNADRTVDIIHKEICAIMDAFLRSRGKKTHLRR